mgnify:CR=1 FL=1
MEEKYSIKEKEIAKIRNTVEVDFQQLDKIIYDIIHPFCKDLDKYVEFIKDCLKNGEEPPSNAELEDFCMNLSTYIYFAGGMCEQLGIKDDISKAIFKEVYNNKRQTTGKGTIADKNSIAELAAQQEYLTNVCYNRAYRIMKSKVENSQELLQSCKKVLSHRMQEMELTKIGG